MKKGQFATIVVFLSLILVAALVTAFLTALNTYVSYNTIKELGRYF